MKSIRCYLCGGYLASDAPTSYVLLEDSRHAHCFWTLDSASRQPAMQRMLRARAEPSYISDDEVTNHLKMAFRHAFVHFITPGFSKICKFPTELQHMIADSCYESEFANSLRLNLVKHKVQERPSALQRVPLFLLDDLFVNFADLEGLRYITSLTNVHSRKDSQVLRLSSIDWTHITIGMDVLGCRTISLCPPVCENGNLWYRIISRSDISNRQYVCIYEGRSLRDVVSIQDVYAPLFDVSRPYLPTAWYHEKVTPSHAGFAIPRMIRRSTTNASGITIAFYAGTSLDIYFHDNDQERFEVFLRRAEAVPRSTVLRYAPLAPNEKLINIGVRARPGQLGISTACLQVKSSSPTRISCYVLTL
jgi:hypothetical protein